MCCKAQRIYDDVVFKAFVVILQIIFEAFSSPQTAEGLADFRDFVAGVESVLSPYHYLPLALLFDCWLILSSDFEIKCLAQALIFKPALSSRSHWWLCDFRGEISACKKKRGWSKTVQQSISGKEGNCKIKAEEVEAGCDVNSELKASTEDNRVEAGGDRSDR